MNRNEARVAILTMAGMTKIESLGDDIWWIGNLRRSDEIKEILDTFDPGFTGSVHGTGRLVVAKIPDQYDPGSYSVTITLNRHDADALAEFVDEEISETGLPDDDPFGLHALHAALLQAAVGR